MYDVGDAALLEHRVTVDGVLAAATVTLTVTSPTGVVSNPAVTSPSVGVYRAAVPITLAGTWAYVWDVSGPVVDVVPGQFSAADPAPPAYATLAQLKGVRKIAPDDTMDDADLQRSLIAASRRIDNKCHRRFWLDRATTVREYDARLQTTHDGVLLVDDIGTIDGLAVAGQAVTPRTWPLNALVDGRPITGLQVGRCVGLVAVTARWGWPAIPDEIVEATLLMANRLYLRRNSPEGLVRSAEFGSARVSRWDPDIEALVAPYVIANPA